MQGPEQSHSNHHNILDEASRKTAIRIADEHPDEFAQVFKTCQKLIESFFPRISRKGREARRWAELFVFKFGVDSELKRWEVLLDPVIFILTKRLFVPLKAGEIDKKSFDFFLSRAHSDLFLFFQELLKNKKIYSWLETGVIDSKNFEKVAVAFSTLFPNEDVMQQVIRHPNFIELITEVSLVELGTIFLRLKKFIHTGSNHAFYLLENPQFLFFLKEYFGGKVRRTESMEERLHTLDFLLEIITRNYVTEEELGFKIEEMIATQRPEYKSVLNSFPKTEEEKIEKKRLQRTLRHQVSMKSELEVRKYMLQNTSDKEKKKRKRLHYCEEVVAGWEEDPRHPLAFLDTTMGYELEHILRQIDEHFPQLIYQVLDALNIYQFGSTDHELGPGPYRSPKAAALTFERMNDAGLLETMGNFYISSHMNIGVKSRNTMLQIIQGVRYAGHFNPSVNLDKINPKSSRVGNTMVRENSQIGIPYWESKKPQLITTQEFIRSLLVTGYLAQAGSAYEFFEFRSLFPAKNKSRPAQIQLHDVWKSYLKRMQDGLEVIGTPNALSIKLSISEDLKLMSHNSQVYPSFYHRLLGRDRLNQRYSHLPNSSKTEFDSQIVVNGLTYQNSVQYFDAVVNETCSEILRIRKEESEVAHQMLNAMEQLFRVPTHNQAELKEKNLKMSVLLNDYKERFSLEISASNELEMQATENSCQFYKKRLRPVRGRMMKANTLELELWQSTG